MLIVSLNAVTMENWSIIKKQRRWEPLRDYAARTQAARTALGIIPPLQLSPTLKTRC